MKFFIKSYLLICLALLFNSCIKDESDIDIPKETVAIEGELNLNFGELTAVTLEGEAEVDENGGFSSNTNTTTSEELPILFMKGEDVMFGYYSKTGENNTISVDDMLAFFFTGHPELSTLGMGYQTLAVQLKASSYYAKLKELITTSLESDTSPLKNTSFMTLLNTTATEIIQEKRGYKLSDDKGSKKNSIVNYEINFTRDGKMTWEKEFPLFATVGLEIVNLDGTDRKQYLLESKPLVASPNAGFWWVYNLLKGEVIDNSTDSYQFPSEGRYKIFLSNGVDYTGTSDLEEKVDFENRFLMGANIISLAFPIDLIGWLSSECGQELASLFINLGKTAILAAAVDDFQLEKFVKEQHDDIYKIVKECGVPTNKITYYDKLTRFFNSFNKTQTGSELGYLIRDYVLSDISGEEERYFYNGTSYGQLNLANISGDAQTPKTEFVGESDSEHTYRALISEDKYKYEVESDFYRLLPSKMTQKKENAPVSNFPFVAEKLTGDATQITNSSTTSTNADGNLEMTFKMGTQDSQFEIKPAFEGKGLPDNEIIDLKSSRFKIGDLHEGGIIFYIDETGEHGLVCALQDQANEVEWGCDKQLINGAGGSAIGTGLQNTKDILAGCDSQEIAARYAYSGSWFLPSYRELEEMAKNQQAIEQTALANGGDSFTASFYYSSTQISSESVYLIHFGYDYSWGANPPPHYGYKTENGPKWRKVYHVRAVKSF
jgi:hypothetical protein